MWAERPEPEVLAVEVNAAEDAVAGNCRIRGCTRPTAFRLSRVRVGSSFRTASPRSCGKPSVQQKPSRGRGRVWTPTGSGGAAARWPTSWSRPTSSWDATPRRCRCAVPGSRPHRPGTPTASCARWLPGWGDGPSCTPARCRPSGWQRPPGRRGRSARARPTRRGRRRQRVAGAARARLLAELDKAGLR